MINVCQDIFVITNIILNKISTYNSFILPCFILYKSNNKNQSQSFQLLNNFHTIRSVHLSDIESFEFSKQITETRTTETGSHFSKSLVNTVKRYIIIVLRSN